MEPRNAKLIAEHCKRPELEAMLMDEKLSYWAMHEAEKVLTFEQCQEFNELLKGCRGMVPKAASLFQWHATAAQRAEAFLRTLGLWEEGEE